MKNRSDDRKQKSGGRVAIVCREQGLSGRKLAGQLHFSGQLISAIIRGERGLSEETAHRIVELYPKYRIQWLRGDDDYKTEDELRAAYVEYKEFIGDTQCEEDALLKLLEVLNWKIVVDSKGFNFFDETGKRRFCIDIWEYEILRSEIPRYVEMRLQQLSEMHMLYDIDIKPHEAEE